MRSNRRCVAADEGASVISVQTGRNRPRSGRNTESKSLKHAVKIGIRKQICDSSSPISSPPLSMQTGGWSTWRTTRFYSAYSLLERSCLLDWSSSYF